MQCFQGGREKAHSSEDDRNEGNNNVNNTKTTRTYHASTHTTTNNTHVETTRTQLANNTQMIVYECMCVLVLYNHCSVKL